MWKEAIPQIALSFSIVLDPLLALSAMHLHSFTPTDSKLPMVISFYLDRTLAKYRELIPQIDGDLAEPLFLAAVMLCRITWLLSHRRAPDGASASKLPLQTYHMLRGLETLSLRKMDYLTGLGHSYFAREEPVTLTEAVSDDISDKLNLIEKDLANLFKNFQCHFLPDSEKSVYQEAADYVSWLYKATLLGTETGFLHRFISTMPLRLQPSFLSLLKVMIFLLWLC
jgi:hypothetical protein